MNILLAYAKNKKINGRNEISKKIRTLFFFAHATTNVITSQNIAHMSTFCIFLLTKNSECLGIFNYF